MRNRMKDYEDGAGGHQGRRHIYGLGLDNEDGHKRVTQAERFSVMGGSEETHERMTGTLMKTFEDLKRKGKTLEETGSQELAEIIANNAQKM